MTSFEIEHLQFDHGAVAAWSKLDHRHTNWPVVYALSDPKKIYVGESLDAGSRFRQHLGKQSKSVLETVRVILDDSFNKSVCLDLETYLVNCSLVTATMRC